MRKFSFYSARVGQVGKLQRVGNPLGRLQIDSQSADGQSARGMASCPTLVTLLLVLAASISFAQTAVDLDSDPVNRVAKKMLCNCGCAQDMTCKMEPGCGVCKRAKMKIFALQTEGKSDPQILDEFVAENGKQILAVTPGLFGTAGPFIALSLGAIVVLLVIRRLRKPHPAGSIPEINPEILERINKDMAKLD